MTLSVIVPTLGRSSLRNTLDSVVPQLREGDELLLVGDGHQPVAQAMAAPHAGRVVYMEVGPTRSWGHAQRNAAMAIAKGRYLAFLDDDDIWLPGARRAIGQETEAYPGAFIVFRMLHHLGRIWTDPEIRSGNVSTQMLIVPNVPGQLGEWRANPDTPNGGGGDYLFAADTAALMRGRVVFSTTVIAQLFGHSGGAPGRVAFTASPP